VADEEADEDPSNDEERRRGDGGEAEAAHGREDGENRDRGEDRESEDALSGGRLSGYPVFRVRHWRAEF
jgi:hypothetical protein